MNTEVERTPSRVGPGGLRQRGMGRAVSAAALIIMAGNLTTSLLGFVRQAAITQVFGSSGATDSFFAASVVPQMFYDLTIGAAVSAALIPVFTEIIERDGPGAVWRTFSSVLWMAWMALAGIVVLLEIFAGPLMRLLLLGFPSTHPGALGLSVRIARVLVPTLLFLGTSAVFLSILYSLRRFAAPAFATALYHAGIVLGAALLAGPMGIMALPVGALVGAACQALVQVPSLIAAGAKFAWWPELTAEVRAILRLYLPVAAGLVVSIVGQAVDLQFKSHLQTSGITAMSLATTLTQFPIGIAVAAMSYAVLPSISADAAMDRLDEFKATLAAGLRFVLFITIPAATGYIVLATPIVRLLFQHHHFTAAGTHLTVLALTGYAIQIPFVGLDQLLIFSFYARKNTVTPMLIGVLGVGIYIASAVVLLPRLHVLGLALANTVQNSLHGLILLAIMLATVGPLWGHGIVRAVLRSCAAAALMAIVAAAVSKGADSLLGTAHVTAQLLEVALAIAAAAAAYGGAAYLLGSRELDVLLQVVAHLYRRRLPASSP